MNVKLALIAQIMKITLMRKSFWGSGYRFGGRVELLLEFRYFTFADLTVLR